MAPHEIERSDGARMLRVGVDIDGTFTDFAAWREGDRDVFTTKVPLTPPCIRD